MANPKEVKYKATDVVRVRDNKPEMNGRITRLTYQGFQALGEEEIGKGKGKRRRYEIVNAKGE